MAMAGMAVLPAWVVPAAGDVQACHHRAHQIALTHQFGRPVAAALDWVTGLADTPVSGRPLEPTEAAVRAEMMLATAVGMGQLGLGDDLWAILGVPPAPAATTDVAWLRGTSATFGWLLGVHARTPLLHDVDVSV